MAKKKEEAKIEEPKEKVISNTVSVVGYESGGGKVTLTMSDGAKLVLKGRMV